MSWWWKQMAESLFTEALHCLPASPRSFLHRFSFIHPIKADESYVLFMTLSWKLFLDMFAVRHSRRDPSSIYAHIFAKWRSVGQTWLVSLWQKSRPGTDRVHRWFTASYEYADMNIQEGTVNPEEQGRGNIQHLLRQPKTGTITFKYLFRELTASE